MTLHGRTLPGSGRGSGIGGLGVCASGIGEEGVCASGIGGLGVRASGCAAALSQPGFASKRAEVRGG